MTKTKLKFSLITLAAFILAAFSGITLKTNPGTMSTVQMYGWGAVFVASCLTVVRGIKYLGDRKIK
jgi:hypothetical protein